MSYTLNPPYAVWKTEHTSCPLDSYYPSEDSHESSSPPDSWYSSEESGVGISGHTGAIPFRAVSPGHLAVANQGPIRTLYRGTDKHRAMAYLGSTSQRERADAITTLEKGDLHHNAGASYWTTDAEYANHCGRRASRDHQGGMVLKQLVPSKMLHNAYTFHEEPGHDVRQTVYYNRWGFRSPREPEAVAQSRNASIVIGPTAGKETHAFKALTQRHPSGHEFNKAFGFVETQSPSDGPCYVQQVRFQEDAFDDLVNLPRYARPVRPARDR